MQDPASISKRHRCSTHPGRHRITQFGIDRLSLPFFSDGIVEAKNPSGELFGFDRMLQISNSRAEAIAQAAINFGQNDDITVLTRSRAAVKDHASAQLSVPAILPSTVQLPG